MVAVNKVIRITSPYLLNERSPRYFIENLQKTQHNFICQHQGQYHLPSQQEAAKDTQPNSERDGAIEKKTKKL